MGGAHQHKVQPDMGVYSCFTGKICYNVVKLSLEEPIVTTHKLSLNVWTACYKSFALAEFVPVWITDNPNILIYPTNDSPWIVWEDEWLSFNEISSLDVTEDSATNISFASMNQIKPSAPDRRVSISDFAILANLWMQPCQDGEQWK